MNGLNTLTSKNAHWSGVHTPLALMSSLAYEDLLAVLWISVSPYNADRFGLTQTSLQASPRRLALIFRSSLCRLEMNPPSFHEKARFMSKLKPHAHYVGIRYNGQL